MRVQLWAGRPWIAFRPLLLLGAPGTGKSHLARLVAEAAGTGHALLNMGGMYDASILTGAPRSYLSPSPCFPAAVMAQTRTANPILCGDELEKVATDHRMGHPHAGPLTLLEPATSSTFYDKCLLAPVDVSHACWLFTANTLHGIAAPLRSRLDILEVTGPGEEHFDALLATLARTIAHRWGVLPDHLPELAPAAEDLLRVRFARTPSVRRLARELQAALAAGLALAGRSRH